MSESAEDNKKLIIDCDPGCDDALALLLAIGSNTYQEIFITTVAGNVPVERTTQNAKKIASLALHRLDSGSTVAPLIRVYRGSAVSLAGLAPNVTSVHGRDGLGDVPVNLYPSKLTLLSAEDCSAVEFLKCLPSSSYKYDLVCTGPLTNIAMALSLSPAPNKLLDKFNSIVVMGGVFKQSGNITPAAEFNFFFDPLAVQVFLNILKEYEFPPERITFVPLDVTERVQLTFFDYYTDSFEIDEEETKKDPIGMWTLCMLQKYFYFHAFSAKILSPECALNKCNHDVLSKCKLWRAGKYTEIKKQIGNSRKSGSSGIKKLPRFCHLHDPLAVWYMIKKDTEMNNVTEKKVISIHTGNNEMRGTVIVEDIKSSLYNRNPFTKGKEVSYLLPKKIKLQSIKNFKEKLFIICGLHLESQFR